MTIREMTILLEVAKYNNMSAASRTLYISQSTVSQTILDIEKAYNVKLLIYKCRVSVPNSQLGLNPLIV